MSASADNFLSNENNTNSSNSETEKNMDSKSNSFSTNRDRAEKRAHDNSGRYIFDNLE